MPEVEAMNILVIKQTSLGDVLHASGHIRAIKTQFPNSKLVLLTATSSEQIYQHNPWVDEIILIDRYEFKRTWYRKPVCAFAKMWRVARQVRKYDFDLAIDLQGLAKSVVFLYAAKAKKKYAKGYWLGIKGFKNKNLHAIAEMDEVIRLANVDATETSMEFFTSDQETAAIDKLVGDLNQENRPIVLLSPYSRWQSKDWTLGKYMEVVNRLGVDYKFFFTGSSDRKEEIEAMLRKFPAMNVDNLAGKLNLMEFVELVGRSRLMITGDSFPMHVAGAKGIPVIALFGPTDESRVGPLGSNDHVIRASDCNMCDRRNCPRKCLDRISSDSVVQAVKQFKILN